MQGTVGKMCMPAGAGWHYMRRSRSSHLPTPITGRQHDSDHRAPPHVPPPPPPSPPPPTTHHPALLQGCTAVHKLKDNLRIFHELAGPVFPPRNLRSSYLIQVGAHRPGPPAAPKLAACCRHSRKHGAASLAPIRLCRLG